MDELPAHPRCFHVSSKKSTGERSRILNSFRGAEKAVITNARCLQEGIDVPTVDCVLFADPKQSVVDIVQAAGRALRPFPGKAFGYIVVPLVVPSGLGFREFAESTEFKQIARVITALSTQDERIAEEFRAQTTPQASNGRIVEISGDVPLPCGVDFEEFRKQVQLKIWERVALANWRPFEEAREFARGSGAKSYADWQKLYKSRALPCDIPARPETVYRHSGWRNWGDWFGTGLIAAQLRVFLPFTQAREIVHGLGLRTRKEWAAYWKQNKPVDIPSNPGTVYRDDGWCGWGDWLGTGSTATFRRVYLPFEEARAVVRGLGFKKVADWDAYCRTGTKPDEIPANPKLVYSNKGWRNWPDWFGTGTVANQKREYLEFDEARKIARSWGLRSVAQWKAHWSRTKHPGMPAKPDRVYAGRGWCGWGDWLGTGSVANQNRRFLPFEEAREYARSLGLKTMKEWKEHSEGGRKPPEIPADPASAYRDKGWISVGDWLGTGTVAPRDRGFRPFEAAREFARGLGLVSRPEWLDYCRSGRRPADIPADPYGTYKGKGWVSWKDWLGVAQQKRRPYPQFLPFPEARSFARSLGLRSQQDWQAYSRSGKRPKNIPANPNVTYHGKGWAGYADWLGYTERQAQDLA